MKNQLEQLAERVAAKEAAQRKIYGFLLPSEWMSFSSRMKVKNFMKQFPAESINDASAYKGVYFVDGVRYEFSEMPSRLFVSFSDSSAIEVTPELLESLKK